MTAVHAMWNNGGRRLLIALIVISGVILLVVGGVVVGIFVVDWRVKSVAKKQIEIANNVANNTEQVEENTTKIEQYSTAFNQGWQKFQDHSPTFAVPQVTPQQDGKPEVTVLPAKSKAKVIAPKTRTVIRYKHAPTPKPLFHW